MATSLSSRLRAWVPLCFCFFASLLILALAGCGGGGGGSSTPQLGTAQVTINWPTRSRSVSAPQSALSATITLQPASGSPATQEVDRSQSATAYSQVVTIGSLAGGTYSASVSFYDQAGGTGDVVANGSIAGVGIKGGSTIDVGSIALTGTIASVSVNSVSGGLPVGQQAQLTFTAKDAKGNVLALTPGSANWTLVSGSASLTKDGLATATTYGAIQVTVSVDGVSNSGKHDTSGPAIGQGSRRPEQRDHGHRRFGH
jgi:hypothetical protein